MPVRRSADTPRDGLRSRACWVAEVVKVEVCVAAKAGRRNGGGSVDERVNEDAKAPLRSVPQLQCIADIDEKTLFDQSFNIEVTPSSIDEL